MIILYVQDSTLYVQDSILAILYVQDTILYVQDSISATLYVQDSNSAILYVQDTILYVQDSILATILFQRLVFAGYNKRRWHNIGPTLKQHRVNVCSINHSPEIKNSVKRIIMLRVM